MKKTTLMNVMRKPGHNIIVLVLVMIVLGTLFTWRLSTWEEKQKKEDLLMQARLVTEAITTERVILLAGSQDDENNIVYRRLKRQLTITTAQITQCTRIYLMGKNDSGFVFYYADSDPNTTPGTFFDNISDQALKAFTSQEAIILGPFSGADGPWVSVLTPLIDPDTNRLVAVLGMDTLTSKGNLEFVFTLLPLPLLTIILLCALLMIRSLAVHKKKVLGYPIDLRRELLAWVLIVGLFLSSSIAYLAHCKENNTRNLAFLQIAGDKTAIAANAMESLLYEDLEALARYFEASDYVSMTEFADYSEFLIRNPRVETWEWISLVPKEKTAGFVQQFRSEGLPDYFIWQADEFGTPVPATLRDTLFPIARIAPLEGNEHLLGFDVGSSPICRDALEEALRTGRPACSDAFVPRGGTNDEKMMMIFRPVYTTIKPYYLLGFAVATLRLSDVLESAHPNHTVALAMGLWNPSDSLRVLADSHVVHNIRYGRFVLVRPVYLFGETFIIVAQAGPDFAVLYPERSDWHIFVTGLVLTLLFLLLVNAQLQRRERLEQLVARRTEELAVAKDRMELAMHGADLGVWDWDVQNNLVTLSKRSAEMMGLGHEEMTIPESEWEKLLSADEKQESTPNPVFCIRNGDDNIESEHCLTNFNGNCIWVLARGHATQRNEEGKALRVCGTYLNITKRKKAESDKDKLQTQLVQAQKMEAVGRLAGGVAHDLNNMLSPIIGYSELLQEDLAEDEAKKVVVNEILSAGFRARDLVRQLLAFSRKQTLEFKPVSLNTVIENFEKLLRRTITEDIDIHIALSDDVRTVMADVGQVEQVIMNLAVNAADAMKSGGRLTIETAMVHLDEQYAASHTDVQPGRYVMLAVSDNGCGMSEETLQRIFDPFFSTKGEMGTGLGLATVYGIVKQHGGNIWVYSEVDKGTTFKIYLPVTTIAVGEVKVKEAETRIKIGTETILLVEDNEQVRELAQTILRRLGYKLVIATNGEEALSKAISHLEPIHLLLTDVIMPGMNGRELYEEVKKRYPFIKVIYMSGYTDNVIAHHGVLDAGIAYVQKPFSMHVVAGKIREVLDA